MPNLETNETVVETNETVIEQPPVDADFEKFSNDANRREIAEKLGASPKKEAVKPVENKSEVEEPEVETAPKEAVKKPQGSIHKLSHGQLRARVRELEAELRGRREAGEVSEPEPVEDPEPAKAEELRARPRAEDKAKDGSPKYKSWEEYEDDLLAWNREKTLIEYEERSSKRTAEAQIADTNKLIEQSWKERADKARRAHEDFDDALRSDVIKQIQSGSLLDEWVLDSELGAEILYYFYENPAELDKFKDVKGPTPGARRAKVRRMLVEIESKLSTEQPENAEEVERAPRTVATKTEPRITRTPPPVREIGGRGAAPIDRARAAVANDDVGAYIEEQNRRDIREKFGDSRR